MSDYKIENLYQSGYSSFKPGSDSPYLGKEGLIPARQMGMTTDPRTANQLANLATSLNQGVIPVEIGTISPQSFDQIPQQHFAEMRRKAKLAGAELTLHAPIQGTDPAGFGERGYDEQHRELVERQLKDVMDKAAIMDERGNMPVTIHGSNTSGSTFKMVDGKKEYDQLVAVNKESGQLAPLKESVQYDPRGGVEAVKMSAEEALRSANSTQWRKDVDSVLFEKETADRLLAENYSVAKREYDLLKIGEISFNELTPQQRGIVSNVQTANSHIKQAELTLHSLFDKAYQYAEDDNKKTAKQKKEELKKIGEKYERNLYAGYTLKELEKAPREKQMLAGVAEHDLQNQSYAIQELANDLRQYNPNLLQDMESFAVNKGSDTFANVAMHAYNKKGEKAPALSIENLYQGMGFSQGADLNNLVVKSKEKFANQLIEKKKMDPNQAKKIADKLIGVTFDVGHLNISKARGFSNEDLVKEAEQIAKHVNKVHITDNFGYSDSHLPIGMGNVPVKELLGALGEKGARSVKINEVGGWFEHFKTSPFGYLLEASGSPVYSSSIGPYWSQAGGFQQSYMQGYGQMLPDTNYQLFGAGFSQLPQELGGNTAGSSGRGRMGGGGF